MALAMAMVVVVAVAAQILQAGVGAQQLGRASQAPLYAASLVLMLPRLEGVRCEWCQG